MNIQMILFSDLLLIDILSASVRDRLIEQLTREIQALKEELESFRLEVKRRRTIILHYYSAIILHRELTDAVSHTQRNLPMKVNQIFR